MLETSTKYLLKITIVISVFPLFIWAFFTPQTAFAASCVASDLVLSEISYDDGVGGSSDDDEFFEIYLPNQVFAGDFDNCVIQHVNQNQDVQYTIDLSSLDDSGIAAGTYLLFGSTNVADRDATLDGSCSSNCLQNGEDDGLVLLDTSQPAGSQGIWFYVWEDNNNSEPNYEGVAPINIGTDTGSACGTGDEDSLSQQANPPTAANAAAGSFLAGSCVSAGVSNLTPTAVTFSQQNTQPPAATSTILWLIAGALALTTAVFLRRRPTH